MALDRQGLNKKEKALMRALFNEAKLKNGVCLVTPIDILSEIPYSLDYKEEELAPMLKVLEIDDYFDYVESDRKGELTYCITLHKKGLNFQRWQDLFRKSLYFKIGLTIGFACFSALIGTLIKKLIALLLTNG